MTTTQAEKLGNEAYKELLSSLPPEQVGCSNEQILKAFIKGWNNAKESDTKVIAEVVFMPEEESEPAIDFLEIHGEVGLMEYLKEHDMYDYYDTFEDSEIKGYPKLRELSGTASKIIIDLPYIAAYNQYLPTFSLYKVLN